MGAIDQAVANFNSTFLTIADHYDSFFQERVDAQPLFWHDRVPRESYALYTGIDHKRNVYRGGLMNQAGTSDWRTIAPSVGSRLAGASVAGGYNNCLPPDPMSYNYAYETMSWSGKEVAWASSPLCAEDLKFLDYATEQVALVVQTGVDFGLSIQEVWNRENYTTMAVTAKRACIMTEGVTLFAGSTDRQFSYDPSAVMSYTNSSGTVNSKTPYITYPSGLEVSTLNYEFLDFLREELSRRAAGAALSSIANMPVFGFVADVRDWERMVLADPELRADWRMANPSALIDSYNMAFRNLRGWMVVHDPSQMRFKIVKDDGATVTAARILPMREGRAGSVGGRIPEPNPEYYNAELAIGVVFMNDILVNQFVPSITTVGSGTYFGPVDGLNGQWTWLNYPDKDTNPLGTIGNFYGRIQVFAKPGLYAVEATAVLYRRCPQIRQTGCMIERDAATEQTSTPVPLAFAAVAADRDTANKTVWVVLSKPIAVAPGSKVILTDSDALALACTIADTAEAPKYKLAYVGADPTVAKLTTAASVAAP